MKLPSFNEFIQARAAAPIPDYDPFMLPEIPTPDEVVEFARRTAERATMLVLEQYHLWLSEQLTNSDT